MDQLLQTMVCNSKLYVKGTVSHNITNTNGSKAFEINKNCLLSNIDGGNKSMSSTDPKGLKFFKRTYSDYRMRDVVEDSKSEKFCLNNEVFEKAAAEMNRKAKWS